MEDFARHRFQPSGVLPEDMERVQENIGRTLDDLTRRDHLSSELLDPVDLLAASTVDVAHKLGREITGWHVVDTDANAVVYRDTASALDLGRFLPLKCSANCTVRLVVF